MAIKRMLPGIMFVLTLAAVALLAGIQHELDELLVCYGGTFLIGAVVGLLADPDWRSVVVTGMLCSAITGTGLSIIVAVAQLFN